MKLPMSWLAEFVDMTGISNKEYADKMTMSGSKVEEVVYLGDEIKNVVTGKILSNVPHPDSDHLVICQVDVGKDEPIQIVTGAPNAEVGRVVPVALHKSYLPGGVKITKGKLRGVPSNGMMCSHEELGLTLNEIPYGNPDGLLLMPEGTPVGVDIKTLVGLDEYVTDFEITSNRPDCLSVIGLARETAATFERELKLHEPVVKGIGGSINDELSVEVEATDLCPRYTARLVKNIKIEPSPAWMRERLHAAGVRPINNIVDITNYVMLEYGQPMHAFDYSCLKDGKIVVRRPKNGECIQTLDGENHSLDKDMLCIADGTTATAVAGVMGGYESEITEKTQTVVFESANFHGATVRITAQKLGMRTEASGRFEKGLDPRMTLDAVNRACELIEMLGAGEVVDGVIDVDATSDEHKRLPLECAKMNALLGIDLSREEIIGYLNRLGFVIEGDEVIVPFYRTDIARMCDLAEEVARMYGYDNIPTTQFGGTAAGGLSPKQSFEKNIGVYARACGFDEAQNFSFGSPKMYDSIGLPEDSEKRLSVTILNPLGEDFSIMRTTSLNGMLTSLATNYNRRNKDVRLYEMGNIYIPGELPLKELPDERMQFTLGMYGEGDFYTMKGVVEEFLDKIGMKKKETYDPKSGKPFLHPGRQANIIYDGKVIGYLGEIHPAVADTYGIGERAYVAVLDMPEILPYASFDRKYEGIAKYPAVMRDISMVVPKEILAGEIEAVIEKCGGAHLESYQLFDIYEGSQIKRGYKSLAYSIVFRSKEKTLEESEITSAMNKILKALEGMGIELRQ